MVNNYNVSMVLRKYLLCVLDEVFTFGSKRLSKRIFLRMTLFQVIYRN